MTTTVRNIRDGGYDPNNPEHVYIGRAMFRDNRPPVREGSKWANYVSVRREADRLPAIASYRTVLTRQRPDLMAALPELKGKTLFCWCAPKACHGDVLAELAEGSSQ